VELITLLTSTGSLCRSARGAGGRARQECEVAYASSIMADVKRTMAAQRQALGVQRTNPGAPPGLGKAAQGSSVNMGPSLQPVRPPQVRTFWRCCCLCGQHADKWEWSAAVASTELLTCLLEEQVVLASCVNALFS
jgi:hypothetical protein